MKTEWVWSLESEAQRIVHTAKQMSTGFYQSQGFLVLPQQYLKLNKDIVVFPDLKVESISIFWSKVGKANINDFPVSKDKTLIDRIIKNLKSVNLKEPKVAKLKTLWNMSQIQIDKQIEAVLGKTGLIKKLIIFPSNFGTSVSFNVPEAFPAEIKLFLRFDQDVYSLVEGVLSALLQYQLVLKYDASWKERELLVDWLVRDSSIGLLLKKLQPISEILTTTEVIQKKQYSRLKKLSGDFLKKLKVPGKFKHNLSTKKFSIFLGANKLGNLTWKERRVLLLLNQNRGDIVSQDKISEIIFRDEQQFSLYALAKFFQRLRKKLEENGIPGNIIETVRKRGYVLK
ncbi:helix-turn-helix domain-containing protein [Candidatus Roizmanbacteria bacterium]|nr:helix-turn-helix domain-containing protein [Candidatus Roizmanbacteria bacterium]